MKTSGYVKTVMWRQRVNEYRHHNINNAYPNNASKSLYSISNNRENKIMKIVIPMMIVGIIFFAVVVTLAARSAIGFVQ